MIGHWGPFCGIRPQFTLLLTEDIATWRKTFLDKNDFSTSIKFWFCCIIYSKLHISINIYFSTIFGRIWITSMRNMRIWWNVQIRHSVMYKWWQCWLSGKLWDGVQEALFSQVLRGFIQRVLNYTHVDYSHHKVPKLIQKPSPFPLERKKSRIRNQGYWTLCKLRASVLIKENLGGKPYHN